MVLAQNRKPHEHTSTAHIPQVPPRIPTPFPAATVPPETVALARQIFAGLDAAREHFVILVVDAARQVVAHARVSSGTATHCLVNAVDVFEAALRLRASAIILVHNHPSGDPTPSVYDSLATTHLKDVGRELGIRVVAHVVLGRTNYALVRG